MYVTRHFGKYSNTVLESKGMNVDGTSETCLSNLRVSPNRRGT